MERVVSPPHHFSLNFSDIVPDPNHLNGEVGLWHSVGGAIWLAADPNVKHEMRESFREPWREA
jgi:hypothetical protein